MPKVKGLAFRSVLEAHEHLRGKDAVEKLFGELEPSIAQTLRAPLAATWYPVSFYAALWDSIQRTSGGEQDYPRLVGRRCAEQDLKLVHKVLLATLNTNLVLKVTAKVFGSYYDTGTCAPMRVSDNCFRFFFEGCIGFSEPMWTEVHGSLEVFLDISIKTKTQSHLVEGGATGSTRRVIDIRW